MIDQGKKNVLGVGINAVDYEFAVCRIIADAKSGRRCAITALAVHGIITGVLDPQHRYRLNTFDLVTPDGQPVRWALNLLHGTRLTDRVYGPDLTMMVLREAALQGLPVYFYGSRPEVLEQLRKRTQALCPGLVVAEMQPSRFRHLTAQEQLEAARKIRDSGARMLFVGLGCPRQEIFTYEMIRYLSMPIIAVGAAFDYHAGLLDQPPPLLQRVGLQWLYRLIQEPRRLWRRYLFTNSQFIGLFLAQWLRLWHPKITGAAAPVSDSRFG